MTVDIEDSTKRLEYFCWDTVHTSSFMEPDFEMKYCIFSLVIGLKSKWMGVGMLEVIR